MKNRDYPLSGMIQNRYISELMNQSPNQNSKGVKISSQWGLR
jgi:hypothetical protein